MTLKELMAHVNDNIQNDRAAGYGLLIHGEASKATTVESGSLFYINFNSYEFYTLAPRKVLINGIECNAGVSEAPEMGAKVFYSDLYENDLYESVNWSGDVFEICILRRGMVFPHTEQGKADAIAMAKAMLAFKEVE